MRPPNHPGVRVRVRARLQHTSPFTPLELGFNLNHTKPLLRLLRNRGVLAALAPRAKASLAHWLLSSRAFRGWLHLLGRGDKHK